MGLPIIFKKKRSIIQHSKIDNSIQKLMVGYSTTYEAIANSEYEVAMATLAETTEKLWALSTKNGA